MSFSHVPYDAVLLTVKKWPERPNAPLISALAVYKDALEPPGHITLAEQPGRRPAHGRDTEFEFW